MEIATNILAAQQNPRSYPPLTRFQPPGARGLLVLFVLGFLGGVSGVAAQCDPGPGEVAFFRHSDFRSPCAIRGVGDYPHSEDTGLPNDSISSIKVGSNAQVLVCEDGLFSGRCELFTSDDGSLSNNTIGNDEISSARVRERGAPPPCTPGVDQIAFFQHSDFRGLCAVHGIGDYPHSEDTGLPNDSISSIKVGSDVQAYVCRDSFYRGDCELFTSDDNRLSDNSIGNDSISSVKIRPLGQSVSCEPARDQVAFFQDVVFHGACQVRGIGDYPDSDAIGLQNDTISSIEVGADVQVVLCRDSGYKGECELFASSNTYLSDDRIGNDRVSSARVQIRGQRDCVPGPAQVALYMHRDFIAPCVVKEIGSYGRSFLVGLDNDSISSLRVGSDVQAVLCRDAFYNGDCERFTRSDEALSDNRIGNDTVTSVKVQPRGIQECPPGPAQASFFLHADFLGKCVVKDLGEYKDSLQLGADDNSISSILVGSNVQVCACIGSGFGAACEVFTANDPTLSDNFLGFGGGDNSISSAKVQARGAACRAVDPPRPAGFSEVAVFNCHDDRRSLVLWTRDITARGDFSPRGSLAAQWSGSSCPGDARPFTITLTDGHEFEVVAVDSGAIGCGDGKPGTVDCRRFERLVTGRTGGPVLLLTVH